VFRSRAENPTNSFHDYLYHNIGQSLTLTDESGNALPLASSDFLSSKNGCLKGYDYFKNEKSVEFSGNFSGAFSAKLPDGSIHLINFWMLGQNDRRIFSVSAPGDHAIRDELPSFTDLPMPTLIVRQQGDAWQKPFVAIYEPSLASEKCVTGIHAIKPDESNSDATACMVEGQIIVSSKTEKFSALLAQDDQPEESHFEGAHFSGSFGAIIKRGRKISELYLGHGTAIGETNIFLEAANQMPINADLRQSGNKWNYSSSAPTKAGLAFSENVQTQNSWQLTRTDSNGQKEIVPATIRKSKSEAGQSVLTVVCELPAGENIKLSVEPAKL
jgi:hypothetical protein